MDPTALASQISQLDASYNPTDVYNKVTTSLGIPDARTRVQALSKNLVDTQNAINAVDPSVTARTSGALVTEAQRGRLVTAEQQPLQQDYTQQNQEYGTESGNLNDLESQAAQQEAAAQTDYTNKRQSLSDQLAAAQKAAADAEAQREFNVTSQQDQQKINNAGSGGGGGGTQVNPAQDFLDYIAGQFKATGGAGNAKTSRQTQDAWANAWFAQNGVSQANRQQYWNLFNKTYNRTDDPTKDWRYAK